MIFPRESEYPINWRNQYDLQRIQAAGRNGSACFDSFRQRTRFAGQTVTPTLLLADCVAELFGANREIIKPIPAYQKKCPGYSGSEKDFLQYIEWLISSKPCEPNEHENHMDHAFFSVMILLGNLSVLVPDSEITPCYTDALTAILLHNSLYQHELRKGAPTFTLSPEQHPLAYTLMLCDELQCWNRKSYGQTSRQECHPCDCNMEINGNMITAIYHYDKYYVDQLKEKKKADLKNRLKKKKKDYGTYLVMLKQDGESDFIKKFGLLLGVNHSPSALNLDVAIKTARRKPSGKQFVSSSSYQHLYRFAVGLNAQYVYRENGQEVTDSVEVSEKQANDAFDQLSLEYQLSNIAQAKRFALYLDELGCFYTDREVSNRRITTFEEDDLVKIGEMEHRRWWKEKIGMGWVCGEWYRDAHIGEWKTPLIPDCGGDAATLEKQRRELLRVHKDMVPYEDLSEETTRKDKQPLKDMMGFFEKNDGIHVYEL